MKNFRALLYVAICTLYLIHAPTIFAGGPSRFTVNADYQGIAGGAPALINIGVLNDLNTISYSVGEKIEINIQNPQAGQYCKTSGSSTTSNYGSINFNCYSNSSGSILFTAHSLDRGDDSNVTVLYFLEGKNVPSTKPVPILPSPQPKQNTSIKPMVQQTSSPESSLMPSQSTIPEPTSSPAANQTTLQKLYSKITNLFQSIAHYFTKTISDK